MKIAVIGLGNIGSNVAKNLTVGGTRVIVADKTSSKSEQLAAKLGANASSATIDEAMSRADVIVLAVWLDAIKDVIATHHLDLAGKIVVDPSNPITSDGKGGFKKTIPENQSSGQMIARLLPEGAELVKAFGTVSADSLGSAANRSPERAVLFYATDFPEAGKVVSNLITASGFSPISIGGIDQSIRIEVFGELHEYGKLGKLVSASEAKALV